MSSRSGVACLLALLAAGCDRQTPAAPQANAAAAAAAISPDEAPPAVQAPVAGAVDRSHRGETPPAGSLTDLGGRSVTLAALTGKPVLLNLWATWCAPCVAEMPTLERAATTLAGRVQVIAAAQGDDAAKVAPFAAKAGLRQVRPLIDASLALSLGYRANLPTTVLLDARGKELWRVAGQRDWSSPASMALIVEAR